jgi:uncharacterized repeat protein (TIGR01451 family)
MMMQNKILVFLISCLWCLGGTAFGQCPNSYTINNQNQPTCVAANNGSLSLTGTTFYSGSTYLWNTGATDRNVYNLPSGNYSVTITDPTNCTYTAMTYLAPSPTGISVTPYFQSCSGTLYANVGWPVSYPVTYLWSDGSTLSSIQSPAPGVYSVTVTDGTGCTGVGNTTIVPYNAPMSATHTTTAATCNASDGSIDLTVAGGVAPYTYYWYGAASGQSVEDPTNLPVGYARVRVRDANNCSFYYELNVDGPQLDIDVSNMSCGQANGSLTVNTQNLTSPTFLWNTGATTPTISNLLGGGYGITVTDGACVLVDTVYVTNGGNVFVYISDSSQNPCVSDELSASASGGASTTWNTGYTYLWNTGETTQVINVQPGVSLYSVTVTDVNGCFAVDTILASSLSNGVIISSVVTDATCGNSDGAIDLTVPGGSIASFLWSPTGATTEDITGIAAGFHIVEATNWSGCKFTDTIPVGEFIEFSSVDASCGLNNGTATVYDYGMTNPTIAWSNGATTSTISNLSAGTYTVTVTNGSCVIVESIDILDAGQIVASISPESTCQPDYLTAVAIDGAAPYTYLWDNGASNQSIINIIPGNSYYVTITDANGCFDSTSYIVPNPAPVTGTHVVIDATCNQKNGGIDLTMTGGALPYNYRWSYGNANVKDLFNIYPGQYSVSITDNNGCELEINNMVVGGQTAISVGVSTTNPNVSNTGGAIDITVSGIANPTFLWSNGAVTEDISNLSAGWYTVSITDPVTGCVFDRDYRLRVINTSNNNIRITGYVYDVSATGTCTAGLGLPYEMVILQPLGLTTFTNIHGRYTFNLTTPGTYTVEYVNTAPLTTTVICPVGGIATVNATGAGYFNNNFYLTNPPVQDLNIDLWDYSLATPGFGYYTRIKYCNKGNTIMSGTVEYDYNNLLGFESITGWGSTLTFHDIAGHKFYWSFSNLNPGACRSLDVKFTVPTNAALGTGLTGTADVLPIAGDATPANNTDGEYTTIVGSWDPNDKQVEPYHSGDSWNGGIIYTTDEELEYTIRFQNTGTAPAHVVVIRDTLDINLLPQTIREIDTKHDAEVTLEDGNILVFTFNNIYLPDSTTDFDASMGFVKFKINRVAGLPVGTQIENTAAIYFDYNEPVITNTPISIIDQYTSVVDIDGNEFTVETMPNPFERGITLKYTLEESSEVTIRVMNSMGQCVYTHVVGATQSKGVYVEQLNMKDLPSGMYLLNVETSKAMTTTKIVKR